MTLAEDPKPGGAYERGSDGAAGRPPGAVFLKNLFCKPFWSSGVVRMGPDMP